MVLHEPRIVVTELIAEDSDEEMRRLEAAHRGSRRLSVDDMLSRGDVAVEGEHRDVLEAYRMFANDRGWVRRLRRGGRATASPPKLRSRRCRATRAPACCARPTRYLRERLHDFDDLANRLLRQLMGDGHERAGRDLPNDAIIVARTMGAAELLDYDRDRLRGLVLEEGAVDQPRRHRRARARHRRPSARRAASCRCRERRCDHRRRRRPAKCICARTADVEAAYAEKVRFRARRQEQYRVLRDEPAVTRDGSAVDLLMNAGLARRPAAAGRIGR